MQILLECKKETKVYSMCANLHPNAKNDAYYLDSGCYNLMTSKKEIFVKIYASKVS